MISWHQSDVIHKPSTYMVAGARKWYGGQCDDVRGNHVWWWDPWHRWLMLFLQIDFPWRPLCKDARCGAHLSFLCFFPWLISSLSLSLSLHVKWACKSVISWTTRCCCWWVWVSCITHATITSSLYMKRKPCSPLFFAELAGIDRGVLIRAIKILEQKGKAAMFKGQATDDDGVKFSAHWIPTIPSHWLASCTIFLWSTTFKWNLSFQHLPESCFPQNPKKETHRQLCYQLLWANVFLKSYAIHGDGCCLVCVLNCQCKRLFLPGWSLINWSLNPIECQQRKLKNVRDCYWLAAPAALQSREEMLSRSMVLSMNKSAAFYKSFTSRMSAIHPAPPLKK